MIHPLEVTKPLSKPLPLCDENFEKYGWCKSWNQERVDCFWCLRKARFDGPDYSIDAFWKQLKRVSIQSSAKLLEISISRRSNVIIRLFQSKMEPAYKSCQFFYCHRITGSTYCTRVASWTSSSLNPWKTSKNFENFGFYFIQF